MVSVTDAPKSAAAPATTVPWRPRNRIAAIDWMRGLVMVLMVIDHASMAFDGNHLSQDSAMYPAAATMPLPGGEFFTRWMTHICAPTFVLLAGVALALSVERRVSRGVDPREIRPLHHHAWRRHRAPRPDGRVARFRAAELRRVVRHRRLDDLHGGAPAAADGGAPGGWPGLVRRR